MLGQEKFQMARSKACTQAVILLGALTIALGGCAQNGSIGTITGSLEKPGTTGAKSKKTAALKRLLKRTRAAYGTNPKSAKRVLAYARALRLSGRKRRALALLNKAARRHRKHRKLAEVRGFLSLELGRIEDAERLLREALDPARPNWRVRSALGSALASKGKQKEAQRQFSKALALKPDHPSILNNLALSYALDGDADRAETTLRSAAQSSPKKKRLRRNLALLEDLKQARTPASAGASSDKIRPKSKPSNKVTYLRRNNEPPSAAPTRLVKTAAPTRLIKTAAPTKLIKTAKSKKLVKTAKSKKLVVQNKPKPGPWETSSVAVQ